MFGFGRYFKKAMPRIADKSKYCNICGHYFTQFKHFGTPPRQAQCPHCGSLERHRHLYILLLSIFPKLKDSSILHFAPEPIFKNLFLATEAQYYDADIDSAKASHQIDITEIKFEDNFFDYVICFHVLEHIPEDLKAMKELHRVCKAGGAAYLCVPLSKYFAEDLSVVCPEERTRIYGQHDHVRLYSLDIFSRRLEAAGFKIDMISRPQSFPSTLSRCNLGQDIIVLAKKIK